MRLLWAETNTPWTEAYKNVPPAKVAELAYRPGKQFFAPPAIRHRSFFLSQTPVIVKYMAQKLDNGRLWPKNEEDAFRAEMLMACVVDVVAEGHDYWHPIDRNASYDSQKEQAQPFIHYFKTRRLPKWFSFFEAALRGNVEKIKEIKKQQQSSTDNSSSATVKTDLNSDEGGGDYYFIGDELSFVDLCIFHMLDGIEFQCPEEYERFDMPLLKAFKRQIGARPRIAQYMASDARTKFTGTGPTF
jgi:glutathione S-transferase